MRVECSAATALKNEASIVLQLLKMREQLGSERETSAQLKTKVAELSVDADGLTQTVSALQSALRSAHEHKLAQVCNAHFAAM